MASYILRAKKSLGQHFLHDKNIADRIARAANVNSCNVVEIGPGPGSLTKSIEKDSRCLKELADLAAKYHDRLVLIEGDALDFNLSKIKDNKLKIVSNLPYNISVPLLIKYLQQINHISQMTLMFQKEVAERIVASPGCKEYGRLSVRAQWLCKCELLFHLKPGAFWPPPKVTSSIVKLTPYPKPLFNAKSIFLDRVVSAGFGQRRKMLRSSLKKLGPSPENILEIGTYTGYSTLCLAEGLNKNGQIHTIDKNEELVDFQKKYFSRSKFKNRCSCCSKCLRSCSIKTWSRTKKSTTSKC